MEGKLLIFLEAKIRRKLNLKIFIFFKKQLDEDVLAEAKRIEHSFSQITEPLMIRNLRKVFTTTSSSSTTTTKINKCKLLKKLLPNQTSELTAVDNLSFGIGSNECFG